MGKSKDKKRKIDQTVAIVAEMFGVSLSYVRMIRDGKRNNQAILDAYTKIAEETSNVIKSAKATIKNKNH